MSARTIKLQHIIPSMSDLRDPDDRFCDIEADDNNMDDKFEALERKKYTYIDKRYLSWEWMHK